MPLAIVRPPGASYPTCLVRGERPAIDLARALDQHAAYVRALEEIGFEVRSLPPIDLLPDACFVEDVALILPEMAVLLRPGANSREPEVDAIAGALRKLGPVARIEAPARIDGGDILRLGRRLFVGLSSRTDSAGVGALVDVAARSGYEVRALPVHRGLHLKSAVCDAGPDLVFAEPDAVVPEDLRGARVVTVRSANVVHGPAGAIVPASASETAAVLASEGIRVVEVDLSEFEKGDAGATCLSLRRLV